MYGLASEEFEEAGYLAALRAWESEMFDYQYRVVRWLAEHHIGALRFEDRWIWPQDVRDDRALALRLYAHITA